MKRSGILWAMLVMAPAVAWGQEFDLVPGDVDVLYAGAVFRYSVHYSSPEHPADAIHVALPPYLELLRIQRVDVPGNLSIFDASTGCNGSATPPFECVIPCAAADCGVAMDVELTGDEGQRVNFNATIEAMAWPTFELTVRMHASQVCDPSVATFLRETAFEPPIILQESSAVPACVAEHQVGTIVTSPPQLVAPRHPTPGTQAQTFAISARVIDGNGTDVGEAVFNEDANSLFDAVLTCSQGGGPFGLCHQTPFANFLGVRWVGNEPLRLEVEAVNPPSNPPPGDAVLRFQPRGSLAHADITVQVQQPVDPDRFAIAESSGKTAFVGGDAGQFVVSQAQNAFGGEEPRVASFVVLSAEPANALNMAQGWLSENGSFNVIPAPLEEVVLEIEGVHADGPTANLQVSVSPGESPARCFIHPQNIVVGVRESVQLQVMQQQNGHSPEPLVGAADWRIVSGAGTLRDAELPATVTFVAASTPGQTQVVANVSAADCGEESLAVDVQTVTDLRISLRSNQRWVEAGGVLNVQADVDNTSGRHMGEVIFTMETNRLFKSLRPVPMGASAVSPQALQQHGGESGFALQMSEARRHTRLALPLWAGVAGQCGETRIEVRAYHAVDGRLLATAVLPMEVRCLPEFHEAVLLGKVFADQNGNGVQDENEPGIGGVMVALSASVYAITDRHGRYHIARLQPGRHVIKVNGHTLPLGAEVTTTDKRVVSLTAGMPMRINFPVRLPVLSDGELGGPQPGSGITVEGGVILYRLLLAGRAESIEVHSPEGESFFASPTETGWAVDLPLPEPGSETHADGRYWFVARVGAHQAHVYSFALHRYPQEGMGDMLLPWGPRLISRLLVPSTQRTRRLSLPVAGIVEGDTSVQVGVVSPDDERFASESCTATNPADTMETPPCALVLKEDTELLYLKIVAGPDQHGDAPPPTTLPLQVDVTPSIHFMVALGGATLNREIQKTAEGGSPWSFDAGGSFFYRGTFNGTVYLTAGADAQGRALLLDNRGAFAGWDVVGGRIFAYDPSRVFRDLDPELYYPTYGDESVTVDERESGGRFFLRLQAGDSYLKWGGINTGFDDTEAGRYVRSLYGGAGRYAWESENGRMALRATGFGAKPESLPARDAFSVTGGSLYFLNHRYVVEGSLRLYYEILDEISGLPVRSIPLHEGVDYEADYLGGRITLEDALPYRTYNGTLTAAGGMGSRGRLVVDYEYLAGSALGGDWTLGTRIRGRIGAVRLGATAVGEFHGASLERQRLDTRYRMFASDALLDLGEPLRVRLELARTEGSSFMAAESFDGGLSFAAPAQLKTDIGHGAVLEVDSRLHGMEGQLYGRWYEAGFADARRAPGVALQQGGARFASLLTTGTGLRLSVDHRREGLPEEMAVRTLGLLSAGQRLGDFELALETRYEHWLHEDATRLLAAARLAYRISKSWQISARRRQRLLGEGVLAHHEAAGESSIGILYEGEKSWHLGGEIGASDTGQIFGRAQVGMPLDDGTDLYAGYTLASPIEAMTPFESDMMENGRWVLGGRRRLDGGTLFAEQQVVSGLAQPFAARTVGGDVPIGKHVLLSGRYERGGSDMDMAWQGPRRRDAASAGVTLLSKAASLRLLVDGRRDSDQDQERRQFGVQSRAEWRPSDAWTLALASRGATTFAGASGAELAADRQAWEGAAGFAFRPVAHDKLNVFGRYALVHERAQGRVDVADDWLAEMSHIVAVALLWEVVGPLAVSPKIAYRHSTMTLASVDTRDEALLAAVRADWRFEQGFDGVVEVRACGDGWQQPPAVGALVEAGMFAMDWLRFGVGYNFSAIAASGVRCNDPDAKGVFVRAEALY